jgi:hypothetical protein
VAVSFVGIQLVTTVTKLYGNIDLYMPETETVALFSLVKKLYVSEV